MSVSPQRFGTRRVGVALVGAAIGGSLLLAGCGRDYSFTNVQVTGGTDAQVGSMLLRDVMIASPPDHVSYTKGDSAQLDASFVNQGGSSDRLVSVRSDVTDSVTIGAPAPASASPSLASSASASAAPSASASASAAPSASASASPSPSASAGSSGSAALAVPAGRLVRVPSGTAAVQLTGLTRDLDAGATVQLTLVFANAGEITIEVPVNTPNQPVGQS